MAQKRNDGTYQTLPYDTQPPFDVGFSCSVTVEEPLVLRVQGTWGVKPVGCRLRFILRDANFPRSKPAGMDWGDISYIIGGYGWKARFMDLEGYILTGPKERQWNKVISNN